VIINLDPDEQDGERSTRTVPTMSTINVDGGASKMETRDHHRFEVGVCSFVNLSVYILVFSNTGANRR
jgi:hypothetical protein